MTVEHGTLTIQAERTPHYGQSEQVIAAERPQGSFTLGEGVDSENLTASYAGGVLHVTIPASPKARARRNHGRRRQLTLPVPISGQPVTPRAGSPPPGRRANAEAGRAACPPEGAA